MSYRTAKNMKLHEVPTEKRSLIPLDANVPSLNKVVTKLDTPKLEPPEPHEHPHYHYTQITEKGQEPSG